MNGLVAFVLMVTTTTVVPVAPGSSVVLEQRSVQGPFYSFGACERAGRETERRRGLYTQVDWFCTLR
jgi:hypothetical protein